MVVKWPIMSIIYHGPIIKTQRFTATRKNIQAGCESKSAGKKKKKEARKIFQTGNRKELSKLVQILT